MLSPTPCIKPPKVIHITQGEIRGLSNQLSLGEVVEGKVIKVLGEYRALVSLKGVSVIAETPLHFPSQETFRVQVKQLVPQIILSLIPQADFMRDKLVSQLRTLLPYKIPLGELMEGLYKNVAVNQQLAEELKEKLLSTLKTLILHQNSTGYNFRDFINSLGLLHENQISKYLLNPSRELPPDNLKGLLLSIWGERSESQRLMLLPKDASLLNLVSLGIKNIELHQYFNLLTKENGNFYFFQLPIVLSQDLDTVDLYLYDHKDKATKENKKAYFTLVFLLQLERLGGLKITALVSNKEVQARFITSGKLPAEFIQACLPELRSRLESLGYLVKTLSCTVADKEFRPPISTGFTLLEDLLENINAFNLWI
jgi:hypothetical protein